MGNLGLFSDNTWLVFEQIPVMPTPCIIVENPSNKELDATPEADEPIYTTQHYNPDQDRNE